MKIFLTLLLAFSISCSSETTGSNNGGWTLNNGQTSNNGTTPNNGTSPNNGRTVNNGTTSNNNGTTSATNNRTTSGTTGGTTTPVRVPVERREVAIACDNIRPQGSGGDPNMANLCVVDADCTEGANGRCNNGRGGAQCSYDTCFSDDDCPGTVCACEPEGTSNTGNRCLQGNCQIDADCGPNGFCSPTFGGCGNYSGDVAYFCHTPEDECIDDADCADFEGPGGFGKPYCKFSTEVERWVCDNAQCVG